MGVMFRTPSTPIQSVQELVVGSDLVEFGLQLLPNARFAVDELTVAISVIVQTSRIEPRPNWIKTSKHNWAR